MNSPLERSFALHTRADCIGVGLAVKALALEAGWSEVEAAELALLVTNAVRHGNGGRCDMRLDATELLLIVEDSGAGFPAAILRDGGRSDNLGPSGVRPPGTSPSSGLGSGLATARRLSNELHLSNRGGGGAQVFSRRRRRHPQPGGRHD